MNDPLASFDIDDPKLPTAIKKAALRSGGYPYESKLDDEAYGAALHPLQVQLVQLQAHLIESGERVVIVFEGRDAAGKGGAIRTYLEHLNPRLNIHLALPKPNDREATQWYFQRYAARLPSASETVLFDRSWYNRAGVERVMGFCTPEQSDHFLAEVPQFERMLTNDAIRLFKFWLDIGREMQLKRFHDRRHDPLASWKMTAIDYKALQLWDAYSTARDAMLKQSDSEHAPWTVVLANDKRRARLNVIRSVLSAFEYPGKDAGAVGEADGTIVMSAPVFLERHAQTAS